MEWCQAIGKAHQVRPPRMAWPRVSGRILRCFAKSRHMPKPPIRVTGMRTGLGQWRAAKMRLEKAAAMIECSRYVETEIAREGCEANFEGSFETSGADDGAATVGGATEEGSNAGRVEVA